MDWNRIRHTCSNHGLGLDVDNMGELQAIWELHREAGWPAASTPHEGELMTLDTVISGCAVYFFDSDHTLDAPRVEMLRTCLSELDDLLPDLTGESIDYFSRLGTLAQGLLQATSQGL